MKIIKVLFLVTIWIVVSGMSSDPYGGGCVPTDSPFGKVPTNNEMSEWDGWWCTINYDQCLRGSSDITNPSEVVLDIFDEDKFYVYELRKAPIKPGKYGKFWFGFELYTCDDEKCESSSGVVPHEDSIPWALIRKDKDEVLLWNYHNGSGIYDAIEEDKIPGEYLGDDEFRILGSVVSEEEAAQLIDGKYYRIEETSPIIYMRVEEPLDDAF
jgi:hypothetical protein